MRKFKISAVLFLLVSLSFSVWAGPKYYVTFYNNTDKVVSISPADSGDWYPNDLGQNWTIPPQKSVRLYTESKALKDGACGVNLSSPSGNFCYVAIWINKHNPPAKCNVSQSCPQNKEWIGTSNPKVTTSMTTNIEGSTGGVVEAKVVIAKDAF